jgi:predicted AAA+ superfamily ATPase
MFITAVSHDAGGAELISNYLKNKKKVQFVLSGSSSRKLRKDPTQNLLPGRVVHFHLDPLNLNEFKIKDLEDELLYGSLPGIKLLKSKIMQGKYRMNLRISNLQIPLFLN